MGPGVNRGKRNLFVPPCWLGGLGDDGDDGGAYFAFYLLVYLLQYGQNIIRSSEKYNFHLGELHLYPLSILHLIKGFFLLKKPVDKHNSV